MNRREFSQRLAALFGIASAAPWELDHVHAIGGTGAAAIAAPAAESAHPVVINITIHGSLEHDRDFVDRVLIPALRESIDNPRIVDRRKRWTESP